MDGEILRDVIKMILFGFATTCLIAPLCWLTLWMGRCIREGAQDAAGAAAAHFGLHPEPLEASTEPAIGSSGAVYKGTVDGVQISVRACTLTVHVGSPNTTAIPLAPVTVTGLLPTPLPYELHIARTADPPGPVIRSGDESFDRYVTVSAGDERAARELLASAMLRCMIQRFVQESQGHAVVTRSAVVKNIFDGHLKGASSTIQAVKDVVSLVKAISGERLHRHGAEPVAHPSEWVPLVRNWREDFPEHLKSKLSGFKVLRCGAPGPVSEEISLGDAHHFSSGRDISSYDTPRGFPRRSEKEKTPEGLLRVEVECDEGVSRDNPRRDQWYSYAGYFLILLVFAESGDIWDARWEPTDY